MTDRMRPCITWHGKPQKRADRNMRTHATARPPWVRCAETIRYAVLWWGVAWRVVPINDLLVRVDVPGTERLARIKREWIISVHDTREDAERAAVLVVLSGAP